MQEGSCTVSKRSNLTSGPRDQREGAYMKFGIIAVGVLVGLVALACENRDVLSSGPGAGSNGRKDIPTGTIQLLYPGEECLDEGESVKKLSPQASVELADGSVLFVCVMKRTYGSIVFVACSEQGGVLWSRWLDRTGGDLSFTIKGVAAMPDGGFVVAASGGRRYATVFRLMRYSSNGDVLWEQELGRFSWESGSHRFAGAVAVHGSEILAVGSDRFQPWSGKADVHDLVLYRVNFSGEVTAGISYPASNVSEQYTTYDMQVKPDGTITVAGTLINSYFLLHLSQNYDFLSLRRFSLQDERMKIGDMTFLSDGGLCIGGYTSVNRSMETSTNPDRYILIRTDEDGSPKWTNAYAAPGPLSYRLFDTYTMPDIPLFLSELPDGGFLVQTTCLTSKTPSFQKQAHVFAVDREGKVRWGRTLKTDSTSFFGPAAAPLSGNPLLIASTKNFGLAEGISGLLTIPSNMDGFTMCSAVKEQPKFKATHTFTTDSVTVSPIEWNESNVPSRSVRRDCRLTVEEVCIN